MRRVLVGLFVVMLLAGGVLFAPPASARTFVVDDDGHATAANCNASATAYTRIQAAINDAVNGDVIRVCPGTFNESVNVNKKLYVAGANFQLDARTRSTASESIVQKAGEAAFTVRAERATIDGFTIRNSAIGVDMRPASTGTWVLNNIITGNSTGVVVNQRPEAKGLIEANKLVQNTAAGGPSPGTAVYANHGAKHVVVNDNAVNDHTVGVWLDTVPGAGVHHDVVVTNNAVRKVTTAAVVLRDVSKAVVDDNNINNDTTPGVGLGVVVERGDQESDDVLVTHNTVRRMVDGIAVRNASTGVALRENVVIFGANDGIVVTSSAPGGTEAKDNEARDNGRDGIRYGAGTQGNVVTQNEALRNGGRDCRDNSVGAGTSGTANTWTDNTGATSAPPGLCVPD